MMTIIVVDDHELVRNLLCKLLNEQPDVENVVGASDGARAMQLLNDGMRANIVLTDLNMPGMNGLELTRRVNALGRGIRVIILTLQSNLLVGQDAIDAGAKICLSKDGCFGDLLSAIRTVHAAAA